MPGKSASARSMPVEETIQMFMKNHGISKHDFDYGKMECKKKSLRYHHY